MQSSNSRQLSPELLGSIYAAALDHVAVGLLVLDKDGGIVVCNNEASRILDDGHGISQSVTGALCCTDTTCDAQLRRAISRTSQQLIENPLNTESVLTLRRNAAADPVIIDLSPLQDARQELESLQGGVLVQMIDIRCYPDCDIKRFALAWRLTVAEAAVAKLVVSGMTNAEIAEHRNVSINTVKTQMLSVMSRCAVQSRIELVQAILKTVPPIS